VLLAVAAILLVLWIGGFFLNLAGSLIHALLVLAVIVAVAHFFLGRRTSTV
jgi:hypothetical protein